MSKNFIARLQELKGSLSVSAFARILDMPQTTMSSYFNGLRKPSVELVERICVRCGVSADWLLGLSDERGQAQSTVRAAKPFPPQKSLGRVQSSPDSALLSEIRALKARVKALEDSSDHRSLACG